jgi:hypothetical protein
MRTQKVYQKANNGAVCFSRPDSVVCVTAVVLVLGQQTGCTYIGRAVGFQVVLITSVSTACFES